VQDSPKDRIVRIGGACGFWGETARATPQLLAAGDLDYIVYDYLAEITMSIMARARAARPELGYATDFVTAVLKPNLPEIARQGVKIISNAGGVNPQSCAEAIQGLVEAAGLNLKVAIVTGDDLSDRMAELAAASPAEMFSGQDFPAPDSIASINAYLGAFPIAAALDRGADIVVTGRVVDSAVTLGACIHAFGWTGQDFDRLAGGSLAGHLLECGPQATGGNFTDWETVADSYFDIGYPIAEVYPDGSFVCTKPAGSGGAVTPHTVGEQMLYEIGDPQAYLLPDVVCDFSGVVLQQQAPDRVHVNGAKGRPPPAEYKVSATFADGYRLGQTLVFYGFEADRKARCFADAALQRARAQLKQIGLPEFSETSVELVGDESHYGARRRVGGSREVCLKIAARHPEAAALNVLLREITGLALGGPPGLTGFAGTRPKPSPVIRLFSFAHPRDAVDIAVEIGDERWRVSDAAPAAVFDEGSIERTPAPPPPELQAEMVAVPLVRLAVGRSGDKGDKVNIGIMARRPEYLPWIWAALTEAAIAETFAHFLRGGVERFYLPGSHAVNFLLHDVLGGGGIASLRNDPQGKGYAQVLLDYPVPLPRALAETL
jgi:hypothetical protein